MKTSIIAKLSTAFAALTLLLASGASHAADGHVVFSTAAIHFKNFKERNAFVPGIGWEYSPSKKIGFHVGTLSDSFGYQATYAGINYGTRRFFNNRVRFLVGATITRKQYHANKGPEVKIIPFPVMEVTLSKKASINISGSPEVDYQGAHSNAVMFFQFKYNLR